MTGTRIAIVRMSRHPRRRAAAAARIALVVASAIGVLSGCAGTSSSTRTPQSASAPQTLFVIEDAERFAALLQKTPAPTAAQLQDAYLAVGTDGIRIFTEGRIENAEKLADNVQRNRAEYQKGIDLCLPAARALRAKVGQIMQRVADLLGQRTLAPAYVLFGAGNSGGTAKPEGLALALEVLCGQPTDADAAARILEEYVAHEITHVYQFRDFDPTVPQDLAQLAVIEGFGDFVAERSTGRLPVQGRLRDNYGRQHEAALWQRFQADLAAGRIEGTDWFYSPTPKIPGQPADMGYWIGKQICEAYYAKAEDKQAALRTLLRARDPHRILVDSGYGQAFSKPDAGD